MSDEENQGEERMYTLQEILATGNDRRQKLRHRVKGFVTLDNGYMAAGEGDGVIRNMSGSGVSFDTCSRLRLNQPFFFKLNLDSGVAHGTLECCWERSLPNGTFRYGARIRSIENSSQPATEQR